MINFEEYKENFIEACDVYNKNEEYRNKCLLYAEKLNKQNLPIIYDGQHFSKLVGINHIYLYSVSNAQSKFYRVFKLKKDTLKFRTISEPFPLLKETQIFILKNILEKVPCHESSKAYRKGYNILDNAKYHRGQKHILKLDIKNYFESLHKNKVYNLFNVLGYDYKLSYFIANLCTLDDTLPQGAPTSSYLSNLLTIKLDEEIFKLCREYNYRYTRYSDDITISGNIDFGFIFPKIKEILKKHDLGINYDKINFIGNHNKQIVTGVCVNKKLQAPKKYRKKIRQEVYYINKFGLTKHLIHIYDEKEEIYSKKYLEKLLGKINFCLSINSGDKEMKKYKQEILLLYRNLL